MQGARTRGHGPALAAAGAIIRGGSVHAVLLSGPGGVGKTTLALDLAAGLLCTSADPAARPCRVCRGCRLVEHGDHPDLHLLGPEGPGGQVTIGTDDPPVRGVRDLVAELALLPLEGGARVAIIEAAHRMNEPAQGALLKTLEEPPAGVTIILCADEEARLLPTVRSRCARIRLGPVGPRDVEAILGERGVADPPLAARLARLSGGRPGLALAYAQAPDALLARDELARVALDLLDAGPAARLAAIREALPRALAHDAALDDAAARQTGAAEPNGATPARGRRRTRSTAPAPVEGNGGDVPTGEGAAAGDAGVDPVEESASPRAVAAPLRRHAAETLITIWTEVARDLAITQAGGGRSIHDPGLHDELVASAIAIPPGSAAEALRVLERAGMLIAANVNPELVLDSIVLSWPRRRHAA